MASIDKIYAKLEKERNLKRLKDQESDQELINQLNYQNEYLKYWDGIYEDISVAMSAASVGGGGGSRRTSNGFKLDITVSNEIVTLPLESGYLYDFIVDWGDGSQLTTISSYDDSNATHTYTAGSYELLIDGKCQSFNVNNGSFKLFINEVMQWSTTTDFLKLNFAGCSNLTTLPFGSITGADNITSFMSTFKDCVLLTTIPNNLFDYNTVVSANGFHTTFYNCILLTTIPDNLFDSNILASTLGFYCTFKGCSSLTAVPVEFFRYNTNVSTNGFNSTFFGCDELQLNRNIFYADGEQSTRFLNQVSNFSGCFERDLFAGVQGEAPDLWNCNFGTETPVITNAFGGVGNSLTSISNYIDIPAEWK